MSELFHYYSALIFILILRLMFWYKITAHTDKYALNILQFTNILIMVIQSSIVWSLSWVRTAYEFLFHPDNCILLDFTPAMSFYHADHTDMTSSPPSSVVSFVCHIFSMTAALPETEQQGSSWGRGLHLHNDCTKFHKKSAPAPHTHKW